jgi:DNA-binding HxlR family transcriptional regulator
MQGGATTGVDQTRSGAYILTLLANPLHMRILFAHELGPLRQGELEDKTDLPPPTTLRAAVTTLKEAGLLARREVRTLPYGVATELTEAGGEALAVAAAAQRWLALADGGPIAVDSDRAKTVMKSLVAGWSTRIVRALAYEEATLTELAQQIPDVSYPSLERRLTRMRNTGLIEPASTERRGTPFQPTDWLRHSIAPLCVAGRWERRHLRSATAPITPVEIEASFLLVVRLALLPTTATCVCKLGVLPEAAEGGERASELDAAGVTVTVERGRLTSCVPELDDGTSTWALGTPMEWLDAVIEGRLAGLRFGDGRPQLAADLVNGLHLGLFGD